MPQLTVDPSELTPSGATATVTTPYPGNGWAYGVSIPCSPAAPLSAPTDVSAELSGLTPFTAYHYRLVAARSDSEGLDSYGRELTFTPGSDVGAGRRWHLGLGRHRRRAPTFMREINPMSAPTLYRFDYGPDPAVRAADSCERLDRGRRNRPLGQHRSSPASLPESSITSAPLRSTSTGSPNGPDQTFATPDEPEIGQSAVIGRLGQWRDPEPGDQPRLPAHHLPHRVRNHPRTTARSTPQSPSIGADNSPHQLSADDLRARRGDHLSLPRRREQRDWHDQRSGPDVHDHGAPVLRPRRHRAPRNARRVRPAPRPLREEAAPPSPPAQAEAPSWLDDSTGSRGARIGALFVVAVLFMLPAGAAQANVSHAFTGTFGSAGSTPVDPYPISEPTDVAVDQATGDVYVTDPGNHRVEKFDSIRSPPLHVRPERQQDGDRSSPAPRNRTSALRPAIRPTNARPPPAANHPAPSKTRCGSRWTTSNSAKGTSTSGISATTSSRSSTPPGRSSAAGERRARRTAPTTPNCPSSARSSASRSAVAAPRPKNRSPATARPTAPSLSEAVTTRTTFASTRRAASG